MTPPPMPPSPDPRPATAIPTEPATAWYRHDARRGSAEARIRAWLATRLDLPEEAIVLRRDRHGRPHLQHPDAGNAPDINWSHSGDGLLVALGHGVRLGVDLERLRPRPRALQLARRYFTATEADWLADHADDARTAAFVRLWCVKEAVLKAHGHGLSFGLHKLAFAHDPGRDRMTLVACDPALGQPGDWQLREWTPQPGYRAALAWRAR